MRESSLIAVIDPGVRSLEIDCFNSIVAISGRPAIFLSAAIYGLAGQDRFLNLIEEGSVSHVIVLGSASSVHDGLEWQRPLEILIQSVIDKKVPLLGICYGHQMLAHMFGGQVSYVRSDKQKLTGSRELTFDSQRLGYHNAMVNLVVTHNEMVQSIPLDFRVIGKSEIISIDAMEHRSLPIFSVQAHPEATHSFVTSREMTLMNHEKTLRDGADFLGRFLRL